MSLYLTFHGQAQKRNHKLVLRVKIVSYQRILKIRYLFIVIYLPIKIIHNNDDNRLLSYDANSKRYIKLVRFVPILFIRIKYYKLIT